MTCALFAKLIDDVNSARSHVELRFCGGGEDLLHPHIRNFVAYAAQAQNISSIGITTNGLALTRDLSVDLLDAGLTHIKFSLDANDAKAYHALTGVDAYDLARVNIAEFCRLKRFGEYQCAITIKMNQYVPDAKEADEFKRRWAGVYDSVVVASLHNWLGLRGFSHVTRALACSHPWKHVQVLWTGQIALCCFDCIEGFYALGDVTKESIADYWRSSKKLRALRQAHKRLDFAHFPHCASCTTP